MPNFPRLWKEEPDQYVSWALSVAALTRGHVFVDLLPQGDELAPLDRIDAELVGRKFEAAARDFLDTKQVLRIVCEREMTPDYLLYLFASNLQRGSADQAEAAPSMADRPSVGERGALWGSSGTRDGREGRDGRSVDARASKRMAPPPPAVAPQVFILQHVEQLGHETQMALVQLLSRRSLPVQFASNVAGVGGAAGPEQSVMVAGHAQIAAPHVVLALSTMLPTCAPCYRPSQHAHFHSRAHSHAHSGRAHRPPEGVSAPQLSPQFLQSFLLRLPLLLPPLHLMRAAAARALPPRVPLPNAHPAVSNPLSGAVRNAPVLWAATRRGEPAEGTPDARAGSFRVPRVDLRNARESAAAAAVSFEMERHILNVVTALRMHPFVLAGPSAQAKEALARSAKAVASFVRRADFVTPADVADVVIEVLAHQIVVSFSGATSVAKEPMEGEGEQQAVTHPRDWHPHTAARYIVAQTAQFFVPTPR